jgi:hypothetical protein
VSYIPIRMHVSNIVYSFREAQNVIGEFPQFGQKTEWYDDSVFSVLRGDPVNRTLELSLR